MRKILKVLASDFAIFVFVGSWCTQSSIVFYHTSRFYKKVLKFYNSLQLRITRLSIDYEAWVMWHFFKILIFSSQPSLNEETINEESRVSNRTWTQTVNPNELFHFGEPEPNLNHQVLLQWTWTLKIVLKWTQTEPEPLTKVRIYFSVSGCRWRWYTHNKSSGDHQQDQQFFLFFSGRNE